MEILGYSKLHHFIQSIKAGSYCNIFQLYYLCQYACKWNSHFRIV